MSHATDVLLYAAHGDPGIEELRDKIAQGSRFEAKPYPVDTLSFSGPNIFMGAVLAFGADYWSWFGDEVQELLDSVTWRNPGVVVPWTQGNYESGSMHAYIERCACGAIRIDKGLWLDRNARRSA